MTTPRHLSQVQQHCFFGMDEVMLCCAVYVFSPTLALIVHLIQIGEVIPMLLSQILPSFG